MDLVIFHSTKNYEKHFLSQLMDRSQRFQYKIKPIWISYLINMQPIRKLERLRKKMHESQP